MWEWDNTWLLRLKIAALEFPWIKGIRYFHLFSEHNVWQPEVQGWVFIAYARGYDGKQGTVVWFSFPYRPDPTGSCPISARSCSISAESSVDGHYESAEENNLSVLRRKAKLIGEAANRINRSPIDRIRYPTHSHSKHGSGSKTPKSQNLSPNPNSNALSPALVLTPILSPVSRASSHLNGNSKSQFEISAISNLRAPRILIVDDSMSILKMCRRAMERAGYAVTVAENGFLALDILILKHREFDVMLTDLQMPVMVNIT
jgi:CheY-like chemotaxis protein